MPQGRIGVAAELTWDSNGQQVLFVLDIPRFEAAARTTMQGSLPEICQNCATRNLALPHNPTRGSAFHLRDCVGT